LFPHGVLGLWAAFRLEPLLEPSRFKAILGLQLYAMAREDRTDGDTWVKDTQDSLGKLTAGSAGDMSCLGQKMVMAQRLKDLHQTLDGGEPLYRLFAALASRLIDSEPKDFYWDQRARARADASVPVEVASARLDYAAIEYMVDDVHNLGLAGLFGSWTSRAKNGMTSGDFMEALALAASDKILDARADMEFQTSWLLARLAAFARIVAECSPAASAYLREAALVNLFPINDAEEKITPLAPKSVCGDPRSDLLNAILDAEPSEALYLCQRMTLEEAMPALAEAACGNDPAFNGSRQLIAVASAAEMLPALRPRTAMRVCCALAKSLAGSQGPAELVSRAKNLFF
jgi:hypothetical protein